MSTVIVCGSRNYDNEDKVWRELTRLHKFEFKITLVVHGGAGHRNGNRSYGADQMAGRWANAMGIPVREYSVSKEDWVRIGRSAGPKRNALMLTEQTPDYVIAFPGGTGTADMVRRARRAGVGVIEID